MHRALLWARTARRRQDLREWLCKGGPEQNQPFRLLTPTPRILAIMRASVLFAVLLLCLVAGGVSDSNRTKIDVRNEDLLLQPPAANWISYNGDYSGRRYSGLSQVKPANLLQLHAAWVFHARDMNRLENTPVVVNGVMFVTVS